ncbi:hypothetical protein Tco_1545132 [Tanacetum coccineum]
MSQAKAVSREKEKGVEFKDVEEIERPRPTSTRSLLTLKPLPKIDPKDKGKKKIKEEDESETESEGIPEAIARKIEADRLLAERLQEEERECLVSEPVESLWIRRTRRSRLLEGFAPKEYGMVVGCGVACEEGAAEVYSLITGNGTNAAAGEFALMGMTSKVQNCPFGCEHKINNLQKQYKDLTCGIRASWLSI